MEFPICLDIMKPEIDEIDILNCKHIFHINCINKWKIKSNDCPYCREKNIFNFLVNYKYSLIELVTIICNCFRDKAIDSLIDNEGNFIKSIFDIIK
jgi:hypothetical protein